MDDKTRNALLVGRVTPLTVPAGMEERLRDLTARIKNAEVETERERCAVLVGELGCNCDLAIRRHARPAGSEHHRDCPFAIAALIRKAG